LNALTSFGRALLLLLCTLVWAQTTATASEYLHRDASPHCCGQCHLGSLPHIQVKFSVTEAPIVPVAWLEDFAAATAIPEPRISSGGSRAPPA